MFSDESNKSRERMRRRQLLVKNWRQQRPASSLQTIGQPHGRGCSLLQVDQARPAGRLAASVTRSQPHYASRNGSPGAWRSDLISGGQSAVVTELSRSRAASPFHFHLQHPAPTTPNLHPALSVITVPDSERGSRELYSYRIPYNIIHNGCSRGPPSLPPPHRRPLVLG